MPLCYMVKLLMGWDPGISPTYLPYPPAGLTPVAYIPYLPTQTREPNPTLQLYPPYVPNPGRVCVCVCVAQLFVAVCVCVARGSLGAGRKINHKNNRPALVLSPQRPADRWRICAPTQQGQQRGGARCCSSKWPTRVDRLPPRKTARIAAVAWRASLPVECWHTVFAQCIFPPRIMSHTMPFSVGKPFAKSQRHVRSCFSVSGHTFSRAAGSSAASSARRHSVAA